MCWIDLMASDSKGSFNRVAAARYGLEAAVYLEELLNVLVQVKKKATHDSSGFFHLDRAYIQDRTTLTSCKQLKCDVLFSQLGFLESDPIDQDRIVIKMSKLVQELSDESMPMKNGKPVKVKPEKKPVDKEGKKKGMIANMCKHMETLVSDEDVRAAYRDWIASCVESNMLNKVTVEHFVQDLSAYTNDKNAQIAEIRRHAESAWRKFYPPKQSVTNRPATRILPKVKQADEAPLILNDSISF